MILIKKKLILVIILTFVLFFSLYKPLGDNKGSLGSIEQENATTTLVEPNNEALEVYQVDQLARVSCYTDLGLMANGYYVYPGAVAFSDRSVALNQDIYVEGFGIMRITDRTALWVHEKYDVPTIDIWMTPEECKEFGLKYLKYKIIN